MVGVPWFMVRILPVVMLFGTLLLTACGENSTPGAVVDSAEATVSLAEGRSLYMTHCMMCHQPQGEGVMGMQPALARSTVVVGDVEHLVRVTVLGMGSEPGAVPPSGNYRQQMLGLPDLTDKEIAAILTYIRKSWGNTASAVSEDRVWEIRQGL